MFKSQSYLITLILSMFLVFTGFAEAKGPKPQCISAKKFESEEIIDSLNLTEEQKAQIQQFRSQQRERFKNIHTQLQRLHQQLRNELAKPQINETEVKNLTGQIKQLQGELLDARVEGTMKLNQILTDEQYKTFREKMQEKAKQKKMWMEKRGGFKK